MSTGVHDGQDCLCLLAHLSGHSRALRKLENKPAEGTSQDPFPIPSAVTIRLWTRMPRLATLSPRVACAASSLARVQIQAFVLLHACAQYFLAKWNAVDASKPSRPLALRELRMLLVPASILILPSAPSIGSPNSPVAMSKPIW